MGINALSRETIRFPDELIVVDLPGFTKDEVQATLENGYLTISAEKGLMVFIKC